MTVSEKHMEAAREIARNYDTFPRSDRIALSRQIADALASAEREGREDERKRCTKIVVATANVMRIVGRGKIDNAIANALDVASIAIANGEEDTNSPDTPPGQVNSPASSSSPEPGTISPETANEVPAQDGGGNEFGESLLGKSNAARPASVDAQPNGRGSAGQAGESVVTGGESAAPHSHASRNGEG